MPAAICVSNTFLSPPVFVEAARKTTTDEQPSNDVASRSPPPMPLVAANENTTEKIDIEKVLRTTEVLKEGNLVEEEPGSLGLEMGIRGAHDRARSPKRSSCDSRVPPCALNSLQPAMPSLSDTVLAADGAPGPQGNRDVPCFCRNTSVLKT